MRVLHIANPVGISTDTTRFLREHGHKSDVMIFLTRSLMHGCDFYHPINCYFEMPFIKMWNIAKRVSNYDIIHINSHSGLPHFLDLPLWRTLGKKIVLFYHGSDVRGKTEYACAKFADIKLVSTPDLLQYVNDGVWLPVPIDLGRLECIGINDKKPSDKIRIVHAAATREHGIITKGTNQIEEIISELDNKFNIEYVPVFDVPNTVAYETYKKADIIIDQIKVGWYGKLSIEAMALGKPVVCYVNGKYADMHVPVCNCGPDGRWLKQKLVELIELPELRKKCSILGRQYVQEVHDYNKIMYKLMNIYETILNK